MAYQKYGISPQLVEQVKIKMKNPVLKKKVKLLVKDLTKTDLQQPARVKALISQASKILGVRVDGNQVERAQKFILDQNIDPQNTFHLIRLWHMFR